MWTGLDVGLAGCLCGLDLLVGGADLCMSSACGVRQSDAVEGSALDPWFDTGGWAAGPFWKLSGHGARRTRRRLRV